MVRRHPILSVVLIAFTIVGLFSFARSLQSSPTLSQIKQFEPETHAVNDSPYPGPDAMGSTHRGDDSKKVAESHDVSLDAEQVAAGKPIMAKMPNQTIRAEVGRAGWKMLHTILSQYPETPTAEEKTTLLTYIKLFSRVYPCRECAEHFQELLKKYPPQVGSRQNAVMWGCQAHNVVNRRLGKKEFDCTYIFEEYDCGCGSEEEGTGSTGDKSSKGTASSKEEQKNEFTKPKAEPVPLEKGG